MDFTQMKAIIVDATGTELTREEEQLFRAEKPAGFILFKRNCVSKKQVTDLVAAMRASVGADVPVLIDQEGGTVARLRMPEWPEYAAAKSFGELSRRQPAEGQRAAELSASLMALDLRDMGITVNCAPVVDVPAPDCHEFLSASRTFDGNPDVVGKLGEGVCRGLLAAGVTPIMKHIPGHGRAKVDSHFALPVVDVSYDTLLATDFKPFKYLAQTDMKTALWAMAAHVVYSSIDPDSAATRSRLVTDKVIRGHMGFDGVLIADDISMKALGGALDDRARQTMAAGMDLTMICNASFDDRVKALNATPKVVKTAADRLMRAEAARKSAQRLTAADRQVLKQELDRLMQQKNVA